MSWLSVASHSARSADGGMRFLVVAKARKRGTPLGLGPAEVSVEVAPLARWLKASELELLTQWCLAPYG